MRKYWWVFKIALADRFVYRADFFLSTFLRFTPIITTIALWSAVYAGGDRKLIGNLTYGDMVSYYLIVMIARAFGSMPGLAGGLAHDIREGELRKFIIQPVNYVIYHLHLRMAHKSVYFVMATIPYAIVFWWCRGYLPGWPALVQWLPCLLSLVFAFFLGFLINMAMGLLSFWFLEVTSFMFIFMVSQYFLSGHQFPLTMLPAGLREVVTYLPFAYETFYPVMLLLGKCDQAEAWRIILGQAIWISLLAGVVAVGWRRGLRRYAAYGG
ncbi:MAG: ABC-2 family transporter protein [Phycisphaerales bacterium]|nr:ABC-2 family transporter protein [Phycisphaerales bacterium]